MRKLWLLFMVQSLTACTLYNSEKQTHFADAEGRVPQQLFNRLEQQTANKNWLLNQLGHPQSITPLAHGTQAYTWKLTRKEENTRTIFLLYKSQHSKTQQQYLHLVFNGDELLKHWLDRDAHINKTTVLNSRDLKNTLVKNQAVAELETTALGTPEPVVTHITPSPTYTNPQKQPNTDSLYGF
jgi:hypothetical protein